MAAEAEIMTYGTYAIGGTGIVSVVILAIRHLVLRISRDATTVVQDSTQREQIGSLREEIGRLEVLVRAQSHDIALMTQQLMKLRFAFIDEQAALLRILNEMNTIDDPLVKARISAEIEAANHRRMAVMDHVMEVKQ
ncbi:MAG: hypothetical protein IPL32_17770 [Chloracidobacterium sp.]|nr:hypothetical protein [Chloracidobacterium sp.]